MAVEIIHKVDDETWKDFQRIAAGKGPLHEWWKYVRMVIEKREASIMYLDSWKARY